MDTSINLNLKTEQTLSPQMLQSLALLPMPILELKTYIQQEIESNPALEIPDNEFESSDVGSGVGVDSEEDDYSDNSDSNYDPEASDRKQQALENSSIVKETLTEHLLKQLGEQKTDSVSREIGELLIGNLDANGFFIVPLKTLFENKSYPEDLIAQTVSLIQTFEPYGICVSDFRESLVVQAKCSSMATEDLEIFKSIVFEHLENLKNGKFSEVAGKLHISKEDLDTFFSILKSFTPYPGRAYSSDTETYIEPEFSVKTVNGNLVLEMNDGSLPSLDISEDFSSLAKTAKGSEAKETASYVNDCVKRARTLISQIELRKKTMEKTAKALVKEQKDFFLNGPSFLKTLTLKDIAEEVGVHETTISRLSQSKYVDTDFGILPMKYFFSQGVSSSDGEEVVSRNAVKDMIANIIKEKGSISDQKISDILLEQNIKCARRTVSKYRKELNIDSSFCR